MNKISQTTIILIAAMAKGRVIGNNNTMPWHLPADLKHFKRITTGHNVLMGRKTFDSIGKPLPNRRNIILTRDQQFSATGCNCVHDLEAAFLMDPLKPLMVIGGAQIYTQCLPFASTMHLTYIDAELDGDTYFPQWDESKWRETERQFYAADDRNAYPMNFVTLEKKNG